MAQDEHVNSHYKDTVFRLLFSDKRRLLSLYNAMSGRSCSSVDELNVVTLENAIYMEVKNNIAFLVGTDIHLWEHQSTPNPNMPLRFLQYITASYQRLTRGRGVYSTSLVKLPSPHFVVFYNGVQSSTDHVVLRLSDAFESADPSDLELMVNVYNINAGHSPALLDACESLKGYAHLVQLARENQRAMPFDKAINKAVDDCIHEGILADFLSSCKAEVVGVSIFEFDRAEWERQEREDAESRGAFKTLYELVKKKLLSLSAAAGQAGQSEKEFAAGMEAYFARQP